MSPRRLLASLLLIPYCLLAGGLPAAHALTGATGGPAVPHVEQPADQACTPPHNHVCQLCQTLRLPMAAADPQARPVEPALPALAGGQLSAAGPPCQPAAPLGSRAPPRL